MCNKLTSEIERIEDKVDNSSKKITDLNNTQLILSTKQRELESTIIEHKVKITTNDAMVTMHDDNIDELRDAITMLESRINVQNIRLSALEDTGIVPKKEVKIDPQPGEVWIDEYEALYFIIKGYDTSYYTLRLNSENLWKTRSNLISKYNMTADRFFEKIRNKDL